MGKIKILLIDYEKDFIKNLPEKLKSRNLELDLVVKKLYLWLLENHG